MSWLRNARPAGPARVGARRSADPGTLWQAAAGRRAITLVELIVAIALVTAIVGVLLGTLVSVDRGVRERQDRLSMNAAAEEVAAGVTALLRRAVAVSALDGVPAAGDYEFSPAKCAVLVAGEDGRGLERATFDLAGAGPDRAACVRIQYLPLAPAQGKAVEQFVGGGSDPARYATSLSLEYAAKVGTAKANPEFKARLAPGEYPRLVRIHIQVEDLRKPEERCDLVTAVRLM